VATPAGLPRARAQTHQPRVYVPRPEVTDQDRADVAEYERLVGLELNYRAERQHNGNANQWLLANTRNVSHAPSPNGGTIDISGFLAPNLNHPFSSGAYHNNDGVLAGGAVGGGVFREIRRLPGQNRVIERLGTRTNTTRSGEHTRNRCNNIDVRDEWWVHWNGVRWWHWDAHNHADQEFSRGELVTEHPLSPDDAAELQRLRQIRNEARRGNPRHLQALWQTT